MLDIQFIRDNPDLVKERARQKGYDVDVSEVLNAYDRRNILSRQVEELARQSNDLAKNLKGQKPTEEQIEEGRRLRTKMQELSEPLLKAELDFEKKLKSVPNMPLDEVPVGASEDENVVDKKVGEPKQYNFQPKNHWELAAFEEFVDKPRAAKVAGSRFTYIKGGLAQLQFAVLQWAIQQLTDEQIVAGIIKDNNLNLSAKPFTFVLPPALVNTKAYEATTRLNAEETTYKLADDEMWLNASAEHSLCNMYMDEILPEDTLPIRYLGYATSFRREAGTYGKDTEGTIRMHQFDKLEMEVFSTPETGVEEHKLMLAVEEYLVQKLDLPYQVLKKCTADIGKPNASGYDIEVWFPGQGKYRETHTADYMTDYQARSLRNRLKRKDGEVEFVHTNDATAFAFPRLLAAIMENYQTVEGRLQVPEVLRPFMSGKTEI